MAGAIDSGDWGELADLLFQVAFSGRLAEEAGAFSVSQVVDGVHQKMVSRHAGRIQAFFLARLREA